MAEGVPVNGTCGLSQKPNLDRSSTLPSLIPGHLHGGILFPLPGPSGGDVQDGMEVADQDQNFPRLETFSEEFYSYPFLVVEPPPSDRLSAVSFSTLPVVSTSGSPELLSRPDGSPEPVPTADGLPATSAGQSAGLSPLPRANDESREIPWEGIHPTHWVAAEDSRSCTSRGSSTSAASSVRYRALEARVKAELQLARARETELLRQLHAARAFPAPSEPALGTATLLSLRCHLFPNGYALPWRPLAPGDLPLALDLPTSLSTVTGKASLAARLRRRARTLVPRYIRRRRVVMAS